MVKLGCRVGVERIELVGEVAFDYRATLARIGREEGPKEYETKREQKQEGGASLERAAELTVFLASTASDGITGRLIAAVWDDWAGLASRRDELARTDVYTLRRIVPADRGLPW